MSDVPGHELRHAKFSDGRWTPACTCGWWSQKREHSDFERHLQRERERAAGE